MPINSPAIPIMQERLERLVVFIASTLESAAISVKVDYQHQLAHDVFGNCYSMISRIIGEHLTGIVTHLGVGLLFGGVALGILWVSSALVKKNNPPLAPP